MEYYAGIDVSLKETCHPRKRSSSGALPPVGRSRTATILDRSVRKLREVLQSRTSGADLDFANTLFGDSDGSRWRARSSASQTTPACTPTEEKARCLVGLTDYTFFKPQIRRSSSGAEIAA
jgi:hypothetical protein